MRLTIMEAGATWLRVATYNVHGCVGTDRQRSEERVAQVIDDLNVDVIGLQELDLGRQRSSRVDQAGEIAALLGWHWHFEAAMSAAGGHYGHAVLSRFPLQKERSACLPGTPPFFCRESRAAVRLRVETGVGTISIINTHLGLSRRERLQQIGLLTTPDWLSAGQSSEPLILLGDFNSLPGSRPYGMLSRHLRDVRRIVRPRCACRTFPTAFPILAVDHIFVNEALKPRSLAVHRTPLSRIASDHFPLVAELIPMKPGSAGAT